MDDEALIAGVIQHDARRAGELHDRLISVIESTLVRLLGWGDDHDDLVQSTFERIVETLMRGKFSRECSLKTWASSVAAHVALNALRGRRRARKVFDPIEVTEAAGNGAAGDAEQELRARDELRAVQGHLSAMKPQHSMALVLHDILGHDLAEIAEMLGITVAAAQSRLVRGRREFLRRMGAVGAATEEGAEHA
jgi:RNA polymerase sigma-70 factor (ECF subfamily)